MDVPQNQLLSRGFSLVKSKGQRPFGKRHPLVNKLPERIADAEAVLVMRARELFYTSGDRFEEEESLDDAMCVLNALRSSLKRRPSAIQSTSGLDYLRSA
jgi:hypothetical protein